MADEPVIPTGQNPQTGEIPGKQGPVQGSTAGIGGSSAAADPPRRPDPPKPPVAPPVPPVKVGASLPTGAVPDVPKAPFEFIGRSGTMFNINKTDKGFGDTVGSLSIGGHAVTPTRWTDTSVKGVVPGHLQPGKTAVVLNGKTLIVEL